MSGTAHRQGDTPARTGNGEGIEEPEDKTCCCCLKSSRPAKAANRGDRKGHTASDSGKKTMPDGQRDGETKKDVDYPGWIPAANSSSGEAIQRQDYVGNGSLSEEKKPDHIMETVSGSDAGQRWLKDKQESSFQSFEDKIANTPERKVSSPEADLSRKQQTGHSLVKTLGSPEVQQKLCPPMKALGSPEVEKKMKTLGSPEAGGNFLSKEQQKIESPRKTGSSSTEAGQVWSKEKQKIEHPRKTVSTETDQQSSKQQLKGYSPVRIENTSSQAGQLTSKEQQKIELPSKTVSTPEESHLLSNEKQKCLIKQETSYGSSIEKKSESPMKTSNAPKQEQYKDNSSLGKGRQLLLKGQQTDIVKLEGINKDNIQTWPNHIDMNKSSTVHASSDQQKRLGK